MPRESKDPGGAGRPVQCKGRPRPRWPAGCDTPGLTRDAITLPAVERVIGGETIALDNGNPDSENPGITPTPAHEELNLWIGDIVGAISQVGA